MAETEIPKQLSHSCSVVLLCLYSVLYIHGLRMLYEKSRGVSVSAVHEATELAVAALCDNCLGISISAVRVCRPCPPSVSVSVSVFSFLFFHAPDCSHNGMQRSHLGSSDKGPSQNSNSCNLLIDRTPLLRAASHTTSHPTSCAIFATRGTLSVSAQLASSDSLPCNLQDDFLELSLGKSIPTRRSSVNLVPKALSSSLHSFTKHDASTSSPIEKKVS